MNTETATIPAKRVPQVGDLVRFGDQDARILRVYLEGASYVPTKPMPVDLRLDGPLAFDATMVSYGPNSGWSWPDERLAPSTHDGGTHDAA